METRKLLFILILCFALSPSLMAQVTIGSTNKANIDALLDLKQNADSSSTKGLLLPRLVLSSTTSSSPLTAFEKGMAIYNTATAGDVTPGYYYSDGSKWVRLVTSTTDQTVEVAGLVSGLTSPNDFSGGTFSPAKPANSDYIYINTADGTTWTYNVASGKYLRYVASASTEWYLANGTTDAGSNKNNAIYRTGNVGIGATSPTRKLEINNGATAGAIKIVDGTQGAGKILTSDASGVGTWLASSPIIIQSTTGSSVALGSSLTYTGASATVITAGYYMATMRIITDKSPAGTGAFFAVNLSRNSASTGVDSYTVFPYQDIHSSSGTGSYDLFYVTTVGYFSPGTYYMLARYGINATSTNVTRNVSGQNNFTLAIIK